MARKPKTDKPKKPSAGGRIHRFEQAVHDHVVAAEVAAEESAGYGWVTTGVEAAEAAVDPGHELGHTKPDEKEDSEAADG